MKKEAEIILCDEHRKSARNIAASSMVLLKNENVLPISKEVNKVAIIGPFADNHEILGGWSWQGKPEEAVSLKEGIINKIGSEKVIVSNGCGILDGNDYEIEKAVSEAEKADIIILALGEDSGMTGEGASRAFIKLPGRQEELAERILKLGKETIVVLFNGRPLEITKLYSKAPAILEAWFPGTEGGNAAADILFGDKYPKGRLSMSFPYTIGQIPIYYNAFNTGRPKPSDESNEYRYSSQYLDIPNLPLLPFGFGLTYTTFEYSDFRISEKILTKDNTITVSVNVKNTGRRAGEEIVQLYIRDLSASVIRPIKELKGFKKIKLEAGEEKR